VLAEQRAQRVQRLRNGLREAAHRAGQGPRHLRARVRPGLGQVRQQLASVVAAEVLPVDAPEVLRRGLVARLPKDVRCFRCSLMIKPHHITSIDRVL